MKGLTRQLSSNWSESELATIASVLFILEWYNQENIWWVEEEGGKKVFDASIFYIMNMPIFLEFDLKNLSYLSKNIGCC